MAGLAHPSGVGDVEDLGEPAQPLAPDEQKRVVEEETLNAATTHEVIRRAGRRELDRTVAALAWSGVAAGLSMGLSMLAQSALSSCLVDSPHKPIIVAMGYPAGFLAVVLGSQQLFTENTVTPIVPFMTERTVAMASKVLKLWGVVLVANLVGVVAFAEMLAHTSLLSVEARHAADALAAHAIEPSGRQLFVRAIGSGWIIALMVWMMPAASGTSPFIIFIMTWLVGVLGLPHVVVGSIEVLYGAAVGITSTTHAVTHYILPVLAGNVLGGTTLVAAVNHAQVASDARR